LKKAAQKLLFLLGLGRGLVRAPGPELKKSFWFAGGQPFSAEKERLPF
jgi:hypothetical protein